MKKHPDHPSADDVDTNAVVFSSITNNQTRWQSLSNDIIGGLFDSSVPKNHADQFPDHAIQVEYESALGDAILFNNGKPQFDDRNVRHVVAHDINRWTNRTTSRQSSTPSDYGIV
jgi:ABC-type oligopeptide transport system substrate-binding subunit